MSTKEATMTSSAQAVLRECLLLDSAVTFLTKKHIGCRIAITVNMVRNISRGALVLTLDRIRQLIRLAPEVLCLQYVPCEASAGAPALQSGGEVPEPPLAYKVDQIVYYLEIIVKKKYLGASKTAVKKRHTAYTHGANSCDPENLLFERLPPSPFFPAAGPVSQSTKSNSSNESQSQAIQAPVHKDLAALYRNPNHGNGLDFEGIMRYLKDCPFYESQLEYTHLYPSREMKFAELETSLHSDLVESLAQDFGISRFFRHQAMAIDAARRGCNIVVSTSTSSGKSLIFGVPVFQAMLTDGNLIEYTGEETNAEPASAPGGYFDDSMAEAEESELPDRERNVTALYIFPTKALAQDQLLSSRRLARATGVRSGRRVRVSTYDGDTAHADREEIRKDAEIIITNPDMLHVSILPQHRQWQSFLRGLRFVIIDEAHSYHGIFGSHVSCVLRRLQRVCSLYALNPPQFFTCSATIANPVELFHLLCPASPRELFSVGDDMDGSPCGRRLFGIWNPPLHPSQRPSGDKAKGKEKAVDEAAAAAAEAAITGEVDDDLDIPLPPVENAGKRTHLQEGKLPKSRAKPKLIIPELLEEQQLDRKSSIFETALLLAALTRLGVKTMAFCRTRKLTELVLRYTHDELKQGYKGKVYDTGNKTRDLAATFAQGQPHLADLVAGYRGGYQMEERRVIEDKLFNGRLIAVTATCALELGIDVGHLDAVILLGYPGSAASMWQQIGRAGRSGKDALALFVCFNGPTDQYFAEHPDQLLDRTRVERAVLDPFNKYVLKDHLLCAMYEKPFRDEEDYKLFGGVRDRDKKTLSLTLDQLVEDNLALKRLHTSQVGVNELVYETHPKLSKPWNNVSLRIVDPVTFELYNGDRLMDTIPYSRALFELYPGAIYMHQGRSYLVSKLDLNTYKAWAHPTHVNYYTSPRDCNYVKVMGRFETDRLLPDVDVHCGAVQIERSVWGYRKIWLRSGRIFEMHEFALPSLFFETQAAWVDLSTEIQIAVAKAKRDVRAGIHGINHMLSKFVQLHIMCHTTNVGTEHDATYIKRPKPPRLMIFDNCPGGLGIAEAAFGKMLPLLQTCKETLDNCKCTAVAGCLGCLAHANCSEYNARLDKKAAKIILDMLLQNVPKAETSSSEADIQMVSSPRSSPRQSLRKRKQPPTTPERLRAKGLNKALSMGRARVEQVQIRQQWVAQQPTHSENISKDEV